MSLSLFVFCLFFERWVGEWLDLGSDVSFFKFFFYVNLFHFNKCTCKNKK